MRGLIFLFFLAVTHTASALICINPVGTAQKPITGNLAVTAAQVGTAACPVGYIVGFDTATFFQYQSAVTAVSAQSAVIQTQQKAITALFSAVSSSTAQVLVMNNQISGIVAANAAYTSAFNPQPAEVLYVFSWGFGAIVFFFFLGYVISSATAVIGRV